MTALPTKSCPLCDEEVPLLQLHGHLRLCLVLFEELNNLPHTCNCGNICTETKQQPANSTQKTTVSNSSNITTNNKTPSTTNTFPFNRGNYFNEAQHKKKDRLCVLEKDVCDRYKTTLESVRIYIGSNTYHICKLNHFSSKVSLDKIICHIKQQEQDEQSDDDDVDQEHTCVLSKCKTTCSDNIQVGARDTDTKKRLTFCTFEHAIEYLTKIRAKEWREWEKISRHHEPENGTEIVQSALQSQQLTQ